MKKDSNILIVGQGLAGTVLSYYFLQNKISHKVLDNGHRTAATLAAAGLINPITGRRYVKSWMIDDLLKEATSCYAGLEKLLSIPLLKEVDIIRSILNLTQENEWNQSTTRPGYELYTSDDCDLESYEKIIASRHSYRRIKKGLQVNISSLVVEYRQFLADNEMLIESDFQHDNFNAEGLPSNLYGESFDAVVFCEGYKAIDNPFFNDLPFQPAKGEAFEVELDNIDTNLVLRDDIFLIPLRENIFWSGGGYEWDTEDDQPSEEFYDKWSEKLTNLLSVPFKILNHKAGIRPSVKGRRPLIGQHPNYERLFIFNGLGTKGTSLAPYFANNFYQYLFLDKTLHPEVNIKRFVTP